MYCVVMVFPSALLQSSRHTPYEVMFGRKAVLPVDFNSQQSYDPDEAIRAYNEAPFPDSADVETYRSEMNAIVKTNIEKAQAKQKEQYNRKHTLSGSFSVGALVLKKDFTRKRRRGDALDYRWLGPYTITSSLGKGLYRLECVQTGAAIKQVNGFHLKPFREDDDVNSAEQKDGSDDEEERGFDDDGHEEKCGYDGDEEKRGCDDNNEKRAFDNNGDEEKRGCDDDDEKYGLMTMVMRRSLVVMMRKSMALMTMVMRRSVVVMMRKSVALMTMVMRRSLVVMMMRWSVAL